MKKLEKNSFSFLREHIQKSIKKWNNEQLKKVQEWEVEDPEKMKVPFLPCPEPYNFIIDDMSDEYFEIVSLWEKKLDIYKKNLKKYKKNINLLKEKFL